jgi:GNAT superfamily N-acetyltransferase
MDRMTTTSTMVSRIEPAPAQIGAPEVIVSSVRSQADRERFIDFQLTLNADDPNFIRPIIVERRDFIDPKKNPLLSHAELELFLATRDGEVVGRIAAINDPNYNQFHNTETGFFGMFETIDDRRVAGALLDAASKWVRGRGMKQIMGPVNLSFNHDCGVLIDGFDYPQTMMMAYNPRYYPALLETNGMTKAKDLLSYELSTSLAPPEKVVRIAERVREQDGVRVRPLNMKNLREEIRRLKSIYNAMLERSWGFVPMSEEEFDFVAARLRPLVQIRPELCLIAEVKQEPVAFSLTLPDSNIALKPANGHLTTFGLPIGLAKMYWASRSIDRLRVLLFGIKPGYRRRGLDAILYLDTLHAARELGYGWAEIGWAAEDNTLMIRAIERMGARRYKTYRMYQRPI